MLVLTMLISCTTEDMCTSDNWAGTYSTEITCDVLGTIGGMNIDTSIILPLQELTITRVDDQTIIFNDGGIDNPEIIVTGCEIQIDTSLSSNNAMAFGEALYILNGDQITGMAQLDASAITSIQNADLNILCQLFYKRIE